MNIIVNQVSFLKQFQTVEIPGYKNPWRTHDARHDDAERSAVLPRQWLAVHLVGQQHVAVGVQGLLDGDARLAGRMHTDSVQADLKAVECVFRIVEDVRTAVGSLRRAVCERLLVPARRQ